MEQAHNHQIQQLQNTIDSLEKDKVCLKIIEKLNYHFDYSGFNNLYLG